MGNRVWKGLRGFLDYLDEKGLLVRVKAEVDPSWEIGAIERKVQNHHGPALLFENVKGYEGQRVVVEVLGTRERYALALGTTVDKLADFWAEKLEKCIKPRMVKTGPCKENKMIGDEVNLLKFPQIKWHPEDAGPYFGTLGVCFTKDPESEWVNAGIYRMMTFSKNETAILVRPHQHIGIIYQKWEGKGEPMPMAVAIGGDPIVTLLGATKLRPGVSEIDVAGGIRGEPIEMVKCETIDMEVPATSEIVLEGEVLPKERRSEAPFGEYNGYYGPREEMPCFKIKAITYRDNPIYQGTREGRAPCESFVIWKTVEWVENLMEMQRKVDGVLDLAVPESSEGFEAVVKIRKLYEGHPKQVMYALWSTMTGWKIKHVIVVDEDINCWDWNDVHWAVSTRVQGDRQLTIIPHNPGVVSDISQPSTMRAYTAYVGIDATKQIGLFTRENCVFPKTCEPTRENMAEVEKRWDQYDIKL